MKQHRYKTTVTWTGNQGTGTSDYKAYERAHTISAEGKPVVLGSSDPSFRGDPSRYSPEDSLVGALSACHMLWYLHLCSVNNVVVTDYKDDATGTMTENKDGSGEFTEVTLNPLVTVKEQSMIAKANELHHEANKMCFLARSMKFPVNHKPKVIAEK